MAKEEKPKKPEEPKIASTDVAGRLAVRMKTIMGWSDDESRQMAFAVVTAVDESLALHR